MYYTYVLCPSINCPPSCCYHFAAVVSTFIATKSPPGDYWRYGLFHFARPGRLDLGFALWYHWLFRVHLLLWTVLGHSLLMAASISQ